MVVWRWDGNVKGESNYAFQDEQDIRLRRKEFKHFSEKYGITTALLPAGIETNEPELEKKLRSFGLGHKRGDLPDIYTQLQKEDWRIVYKDEISVIYRSP